MPEFTVIRVEEFETAQPVFKLLRNGRCRYDEFVSEVKATSNLESELDELFAILEDVANCNGILPKNLYRKLHLSKRLKYKGYECKTKHLRLYVFHDKKTGQIIAFGGMKGDQDEDLDKFEKLLKEYQSVN